VIFSIPIKLFEPVVANEDVLEFKLDVYEFILDV
jgi:hypothetical protein